MWLDLQLDHRWYEQHDWYGARYSRKVVIFLIYNFINKIYQILQNKFWKIIIKTKFNFVKCAKVVNEIDLTWHGMGQREACKWIRKRAFKKCKIFSNCGGSHCNCGGFLDLSPPISWEKPISRHVFRQQRNSKGAWRAHSFAWT